MFQNGHRLSKSGFIQKYCILCQIDTDPYPIFGQHPMVGHFEFLAHFLFTTKLVYSTIS